MLVIIGLKCFSPHVYGEAEFWFASIKIIGIFGLLIMALVFICGGGPRGDAYGFRYWHHPGPVNECLVAGASGRLCAFVGTITYLNIRFPLRSRAPCCYWWRDGISTTQSTKSWPAILLPFDIFFLYLVFWRLAASSLVTTLIS